MASQNDSVVINLQDLAQMASQADDTRRALEQNKQAAPKVEDLKGKQEQGAMLDGGRGNFKCGNKDCKETFDTYEEMKFHLAHHFRCTAPGCDKAYSSASHLRRHQRIHTADKPYSCPRCGRSFFLAHHLVYHERTHTGEKPYTCAHPGCGKSYSQPGDYYRHLRKHTGKTPYACEYPGCGKSFIRGRDLENHKKKIHIGAQPHVDGASVHQSQMELVHPGNSDVALMQAPVDPVSQAILGETVVAEVAASDSHHSDDRREH